MFIFFFSKAIQFTQSFILECYTPLILYTSTHTCILILMQTIHLVHCNLCLLFLLLYCELYTSTLLCYFFCMRIHTPLCLYNSGIVVLTICLYCFTLLLLYACTPVHLYTFMPVHLYVSTPVLLYTSTPVLLNNTTPLHLYVSTPLHVHLYASTLVRHSFTVHFSVHFFCCTFYYGSRHKGIEV